MISRLLSHTEPGHVAEKLYMEAIDKPFRRLAVASERCTYSRLLLVIAGVCLSHKPVGRRQFSVHATVHNVSGARLSYDRKTVVNPSGTSSSRGLCC